MMSGGTPYIYGGEEFLSSYISTNGESICNSNSSFCFNVKEKNKIIDWSYAKKNENMIDSFKSFVNFRKSDGTIIQTKANIIQNNVKIYSDDNKKGVIGYTRSYPGAYTKRIQEVFVVYNFSNNDFDIEKSNEKGIKGLYNYNQSKREGDIIHLNSNSFYTEKKIKQPKISGWLALLIVVAMIGSIYAFNITMNRILVEKRGYDIEKIKKKYRPFIRKDKIENNNTEQNDSNEESNKKE